MKPNLEWNKEGASGEGVAYEVFMMLTTERVGKYFASATTEEEPPDCYINLGEFDSRRQAREVCQRHYEHHLHKLGVRKVTLTLEIEHLDLDQAYELRIPELNCQGIGESIPEAAASLAASLSYISVITYNEPDERLDPRALEVKRILRLVLEDKAEDGD